MKILLLSDLIKEAMVAKFSSIYAFINAMQLSLGDSPFIIFPWSELKALQVKLAINFDFLKSFWMIFFIIPNKFQVAKYPFSRFHGSNQCALINGNACPPRALKSECYQTRTPPCQSLRESWTFSIQLPYFICHLGHDIWLLCLLKRVRFTISVDSLENVLGCSIN